MVFFQKLKSYQYFINNFVVIVLLTQLLELMKRLILAFITGVVSLTLHAQSLSGKHHIKYLEVNTMQSDYGVAYLDDDKLIFSAPANDKGTSTQQELYVGTIDTQGELLEKERVGGLSDNKISKGGVTYSNDHKIVYFSTTKYKRKRDKESYTLYKANVDGSGTWTDIQKLPFNSSRYSIEDPYLSPDGTKLYFVSNGLNNYGGKDIFSVEVHEDGTYGEPVNLGDKINTPKDEITPFVTDDNLIYYSSNGRPDNYGGFDVYAAEIFNNIVSEPLHLEAPVNSVNDDFAYIVNHTKDKGYFASNRLQGKNNNDIYSFTIKEEQPEICQQVITGIVRDKETNQILNDAAITLFDNDGNQIQQVVTNNEGFYSLTLDCNQTYTLVASTLHHIKEEHIVNTANYKNAPKLEANKFLVRKPVEENVAEGENAVEKKKETVVNNYEESLSPVYFGFDESNITKEAAEDLDRVAEIMKENKTLQLEVAAFTDSRGSDAYNKVLSNKRAQSTINYLVSKGVSKSRIKGKGYGESKMVNICVDGVECSETAHAKNRRTEMTFTVAKSSYVPVKDSSQKTKISQVETTLNSNTNNQPAGDIALAGFDYNNFKKKQTTTLMRI